MPTGTMWGGGVSLEVRGQCCSYFICMCVLSACALCEYRACRGEKKVLALLEPELRRIASRHGVLRTEPSLGEITTEPFLQSLVPWFLREDISLGPGVHGSG